MGILNLLGGFKVYLLIGAGCLAMGFAGGMHWNAVALEKLKAADARAAADAAMATVADLRHRDDITASIGAAAAQKQVAIQTITNEHLREVPVYVTPKADAQCIVPFGAVRLHDAGAQGVPTVAIPLPAGKSDGDASGVALSRLLSTVDANYGSCQEARQKLIDLQDWVRGQLAANSKP